MALTKDNRIGRIEIFENGQIQLRQDRVILEDDVELLRTYFRQVLNPGDDIAAYPARVRAIAAVVWTPAVIAAFKAFRDAQRI